MRRKTLLTVMVFSVFPLLFIVSAATAAAEAGSALPLSWNRTAHQWSVPVEAPLILAQNPTS